MAHGPPKKNGCLCVNFTAHILCGGRDLNRDWTGHPSHPARRQHGRIIGAQVEEATDAYVDAEVGLLSNTASIMHHGNLVFYPRFYLN